MIKTMSQLNQDFSSSSFYHDYPGLNVTTPSLDLAMVWYTYYYHHRNVIYMFWGSITVKNDWLMTFARIRANFPFCSSMRLPISLLTWHSVRQDWNFLGTGDIRLIWETAKQEWLIPDSNCWEYTVYQETIWWFDYPYMMCGLSCRKMLSPEYKCRHCAYVILECIFRMVICVFLIRIYAKLVSTHLINTTPSLIKPLTWRQTSSIPFNDHFWPGPWFNINMTSYQ